MSFPNVYSKLKQTDEQGNTTFQVSQSGDIYGSSMIFPDGTQQSSAASGSQTLSATANGDILKGQVVAFGNDGEGGVNATVLDIPDPADPGSQPVGVAAADVADGAVGEFIIFGTADVIVDNSKSISPQGWIVTGAEGKVATFDSGVNTGESTIVGFGLVFGSGDGTSTFSMFVNPQYVNIPV